jgi:hypothetical protein
MVVYLQTKIWISTFWQISKKSKQIPHGNCKSDDLHHILKKIHQRIIFLQVCLLGIKITRSWKKGDGFSF